MKIVKELALYIVMLAVVIMLGSVWNVSTAKELSIHSNDALISDIDLEITQMRSELLRKEFLNSSVSHESVVNSAVSDLSKENESNKSLILLEIEKVKNEEKIQAKAEREAQAKAKAEREAQAKAEAEREAQLEADKKANEISLNNKQSNINSISNSGNTAKQQVKKAEVQQQTFYMESSAYTSTCKGCTGITSSGYNVRNTIYYNGYRVIAADRSVLPLGTLVNIEGVGKAVVLDTGGAIKGNKIDILVSNDNEAYSYGRKHNIKVTVLGKLF